MQRAQAFIGLNPRRASMPVPTTPRPSPPHRPPLLRARSAKSHLRTDPRPPPIPPSLIASPLLHSPRSIFRRSFPPKIPSQRDEEWLRDTVPVPASSLDQSPHQSPRGRLRRATSDPTRAQSTDAGAEHVQAPARDVPPASPPLVAAWRSRPLPVPAWSDVR
ncbi:hypothetical protein K488DRAFT_88354 [Vararia minispora EC-137]|uniref:Uncharacterized protein n=1 Tax=Vararia minispora EC-137 TaxID=1314806 RepID=A0ACB8QDF1_9AGAM|nr:hypothetical protein K488DRAFT_88354 [Vararia minispora EC-137]